MIRSACFGLVLAAFLAAPADDFTALMAVGQAALAAQDYTGAQEALEKAVSLRPDDPAAHYALARAYGGEKKYQLATKHFQETLRLAPGSPMALIDLAAIEENSGRYDEAEKHYREALSRGPNTRAERGLATLMSKQGKGDEAVASLRRLADADASDLESRYQLGLALKLQGDCAGAAGELRKILVADPKHVGALLNLGNCLNRLGQAEEGGAMLERFQQATKEEADRVDRERRSYFLLLDADRGLDAGDVDAALRSIEEAVRINPADAKAHAVRGQCLEAKGRVREAMESYVKAAELNTTDPIIAVEAGRMLGKVGRFADAIPYLERAVAIDPLMPEPHMLLAAVYYQLGRKDEGAAEEAVYRKLAAAPRGGTP